MYGRPKLTKGDLDYIFQLLAFLVSATAGGAESPRLHMAAKFYVRLRMISRVFRASKLSVLKLIEIVILWVYYTIPFGFK